MTVLKDKPVVEFDVKNKDHLRIMAKILSGKSVADEVVRFDVSHPFTSAPTQAMYMMAQEYLVQKGITIDLPATEFSRVADDSESATIVSSNRKTGSTGDAQSARLFKFTRSPWNRTHAGAGVPAR